MAGEHPAEQATATAASDEPRATDPDRRDRAHSNDDGTPGGQAQEPVDDRPMVGSVDPEDYPKDRPDG
ncbi:hypothetical protein ABS767_16405 [Sphingomonas sp. ST-64]|uniref:Uncharacterized protein n=1 Tax=Sphingomonas plantiphila TaxID=3163295 RepID=A0ABW8YR93_9SPHN